MRYRTSGSANWLPAAARFEDQRIVIEVDKQEFTAPVVTFDNGEKDYYVPFANAAGLAAQSGIELMACANCLRFRFSGMSQQVSNGRQGYCMLIGFRKNEAIVTIDHLCDRHEPVPGWPYDLDTAHKARLDAPPPHSPA